MDNSFWKYASDQFLTSFKTFGTEVYYVPAVSSKKNKFGEQTFSFDEASKVKLNAIIRREEVLNADLASSKTGRTNYSANFVSKQLKDNLVVLKSGDAIDIVGVDGSCDRFLITGFSEDSNKINPTEIYQKVEITNISLAFRK